MDPAPCSLLPYPLGWPRELQGGHQKRPLRDPELRLLSGCPPEREGAPQEAASPSGTPERSWRGHRALSPGPNPAGGVAALEPNGLRGPRPPGAPVGWYRLHRPKSRGCRVFSPRAPGNISTPEKGGFTEKVIGPLDAEDARPGGPSGSVLNGLWQNSLWGGGGGGGGVVGEVL